MSVQVPIPPIARAALLRGAAGIMVAHNHPVRDSQPSPEDVAFTRRLMLSMSLVGVSVEDHIIFGEGGCYSMRRDGPWQAGPVLESLADLLGLSAVASPSARQGHTQHSPEFEWRLRPSQQEALLRRAYALLSISERARVVLDGRAPEDAGLQPGHPIRVIFEPPGVISVHDPLTGVLLARSKSGHPHTPDSGQAR